MLRSILRDDATWILLRRAAVMWVLVRLVFVAVSFERPDVTPSPIAAALLAAVLSVAEWRRRRESVFWRNLGVSLRLMVAVALTAAVIGEILLFIASRNVFPHG